MQVERLKILLEYLEEEPNEPFNIYAVAMEYINKDKKQALVYLEELLKNHPDYLPTYYHAADLMVEFEMDNAEEVYQKGIEVARNQGNTKAERELKSAYEMNFY